nr:ABC-three component system middle component 6 [Staphylococcus shinii]
MKMIIDKDSNPKDTIYYISACALKIICLNKYDLESLFELLKSKYNELLDYTTYLLSLNFLFLLNKIKINHEGVLECL